MNTLYDAGYQTIKDLELLLQIVHKLDAVVLDIRFSPRARNPLWNGVVLQRKLIERYIHVPELGNVNYKDWDAPIKIADIEKGVLHIACYLDRQPVILLCACAARRGCHRTVVVDAFKQHYPQTISEPLDLAGCRAIAQGPGQIALF